MSRNREITEYAEAMESLEAVERVIEFKAATTRNLCETDRWVSPDQKRSALAVFHSDVEAASTDPEGVHIHGLRRTFATRLIKAGADPKTVQTLLGHSTLNLTLQLYTDGNAMNLKGAIDELPDLKVEESKPWYKAARKTLEQARNAG